jgi:CheY-like chemotaxis protein/HPt (histidine-containing phosphotransfer) domain-containing protein/anti-sigma regulatory factor (Ser/Thr protein kinase)
MEVGPFERQEIKSDAVRVRQILDNLLSNALKFTKRGGVTLRASLALSQSDQGVLHLSVTDTGPGIASEHHANIFASFAQADETRTRAHDGAGVGLFLVRELVKRLGGRVDVDSVVGEGATFTVTLPVVLVDRQFVESSASQSAPTPRETKPTALLAVAKEFSIAPLAESAPKRGREHAEEMQPSAQRPRILVAEDNPTNQAVALASLRRMGLDATLARDGVEALQIFQEGRFDLILMDCHMPRMDGIAATAAIRTIEHARTDRPVPIIAVTADMTSENTQQCRAAGITDIMSKPFSFSEFAETLNRYLKGEAAERALQPAVQSPSVPEKAANAVIDLDAGFDHACIDNLRALVDEDSPDFVLEVIGTYRESAALQVSELHAAISDRVPERVSQIAHSLKSSSAYVGAVGFARLMKELELAAKNSAKEELFAFRPRIDAAFSSASGFLVEVIAKGGVHG